jgi:acyl dehydratase
MSETSGGQAAPVILGERRGPFAGRLTTDLIRRYAEATRDPNPGPLAGAVVPPAAIVTQIWEAQQAGFGSLVSEKVRDTMTGGVHGEHDIVLHRPIEPGEGLRTWVEGHGSRRAGRHSLITLRYVTYDDRDAAVAEQWWTTVMLNASGEPSGEAAPGHAFPEEARAHPAGTYRITVDDEMPRRYAEVSGDWSVHHFDDESAQANGFERRFLHGLCTLGLCAQGIVSLAGTVSPARIRRLAVRFAAPAYVGDDLDVRLYEAGPGAYAFEAHAGGSAVISNGLAVLDP